jgi:hypothetical protein
MEGRGARGIEEERRATGRDERRKPGRDNVFTPSEARRPRKNH